VFFNAYAVDVPKSHLCAVVMFFFLDISICACLHEYGDRRGYVNVLVTSSRRDKESDHGEECNRAKKLGRRSRITEQNDGERGREYKRDHMKYSASVEELAMESEVWEREGERERERRGKGNPKTTQSTLLNISSF
jgi:hypothetical protein